MVGTPEEQAVKKARALASLWWELSGEECEVSDVTRGRTRGLAIGDGTRSVEFHGTSWGNVSAAITSAAEVARVVFEWRASDIAAKELIGAPEGMDAISEQG